MAAGGYPQPPYQQMAQRPHFQTQVSPHAGSLPMMQQQQHHQQQQQQQQQQQFGSPAKEVNMATLCKIGQETVQEIVQKTMDIFSILKQIQFPQGVPASGQAYQERKAKLEETMKHMEDCFKKLRLVHDAVNQDTSQYNTTQIENLIPMLENGEVTGERAKVNDSMKYASDELREMKDQVASRNRELKLIIDQLRTMTWEINTMLAMRKM